MRILVVEDEPKVAAFIKQGLEESGHEVLSAYDGAMGKRLALEGSVDMVLLDVILPIASGIETCKAIRQAGGQMPILMLTALGTTNDKVLGLDAGADDYLVKPFEFQELLARIRSLGRRGHVVQVTEEKPSYKDLQLDPTKKEAVRGDHHIHLTSKEYALAEFFVLNPERVHSRTELISKIWKLDNFNGTNVVESYIKILRQKIDRDFEPKLIHTRYGQGYILTDRP